MPLHGQPLCRCAAAGTYHSQAAWRACCSVRSSVCRLQLNACFCAARMTASLAQPLHVLHTRQPLHAQVCQSGAVLRMPLCMQTPKDEDRAAINRPKVTMLYAPGQDTTLSDQLSNSLLPQPILHADALLAAQEYLEQFVQQMPDGQSMPGEALTLLGLKRLGSSSITRDAAELYIEAALAPVRTAVAGHASCMYSRSPACNSSCSQARLSAMPAHAVSRGAEPSWAASQHICLCMCALVCAYRTGAL